MEMSRCRRASMLTLALVECILFGFILDGWPSVNYVLKSDGVFSYLCDTEELTSNNTMQNLISGYSDQRVISKLHIINNASHNRNSINPHMGLDLSQNGFMMKAPGDVSASVIRNQSYPTCTAQDDMLNAAYLVSNFVGQGASAGLGFIFDRFGLRVSRIFSTVCFLSGVLMMSFHKISYSWLVFPSTVLISLSNMMVIFTVTHVSLVAGMSQATFLALLSGAIDLSAFVTSLLQISYDAGYSRSVGMYVYASLWIIHILNTIFLSPQYKVYEEEDDSKKTSMETENNNKNNQVKGARQSSGGDDMKPFSHYAFSSLYVIHVLYFSVVQLRFWFQLGSFNSWLSILVDGDIAEVSRLTLVFEYLHFLAVVIAPLAGIITDWQINKSEKEREKEHLLKDPNIVADSISRATDVVPVLVFAILSAICLSISAMFWTVGAAYSISVFTVTLKATMYSSHLVFCQSVFPKEHYGKLVGVVVTLASIIDLIEIPLFSWAQNNSRPFEAVHIGLLVVTVMTLIHPLLIWIRNRRR